MEHFISTAIPCDIWNTSTRYDNLNISSDLTETQEIRTPSLLIGVPRGVHCRGVDALRFQESFNFLSLISFPLKIKIKR